MQQKKMSETSSKTIYYQEMFIMTSLPVLHLTGVVSNIICAKIFSAINNTLKTNTFRLLTTNSIISALFHLFCSFIPFTEWMDESFLKFYTQYGAIFLCRSLEMISTFINVSIVFDRYLCVSKMKIKRRKYKLSLCIFIYSAISSVLSLPNTFFTSITKINLSNQIKYFIFKNLINFLNNTKSFIISIQYAISILSILIVIFGNFLIIHKLHVQLNEVSSNLVKYSSISKRLNEKNQSNIEYNQGALKSVKRNTRAVIEKQTTMLVFVSSFIFVVNQISIQVLYTACLFIKTNTVSFNYIFIFYNFFSYIFHGTNLFIYYCLNPEFALRLKQLFSKST
jgi:hypothetical protein